MCDADPFLVLPAGLYAACIPARLVLGIGVSSASRPSQITIALILVIVVMGLASKRNKINLAGVSVWKQYNRAIFLLGTAAVALALGDTKIASALIITDAIAGLISYMRCRVSC